MGVLLLGKMDFGGQASLDYNDNNLRVTSLDYDGDGTGSLAVTLHKDGDPPDTRMFDLAVAFTANINGLGLFLAPDLTPDDDWGPTIGANFEVTTSRSP